MQKPSSPLTFGSTARQCDMEASEVSPSHLEVRDHFLAKVIREHYDVNNLAYHNDAHINYMLSGWDKAKFALGMSDEEWLTGSLAIIFHDAVYVPGSKHNEADSALLALECLADERELSQKSKTIIFDTILDTRHDGSLPGSLISAVVCDLDLWGLADYQGHYATYCQRIKDEFTGAGFTDLQWLAGRISFLKSMMERPTIYWSSFAAWRGESARQNLSMELWALESL